MKVVETPRFFFSSFVVLYFLKYRTKHFSRHLDFFSFTFSIPTSLSHLAVTLIFIESSEFIQYGESDLWLRNLVGKSTLKCVKIIFVCMDDKWFGQIRVTVKIINFNFVPNFASEKGQRQFLGGSLNCGWTEKCRIWHEDATE